MIYFQELSIWPPLWPPISLHWGHWRSPKITIFKRLHDFWCGEFVVRWYRTFRTILRDFHAKTPRLSSPNLELWQRDCKKSPKITIFKRLRDFWFGEFVVRYYWTIWEVTRVTYAKTPGLYQVPNWSYGQKNKKGGNGWLREVQGVGCGGLYLYGNVSGINPLGPWIVLVW